MSLNYAIISLNIGLVPMRRQAIILNQRWLIVAWTIANNFIEIEIYNFPYTKMSSAKKSAIMYRSQCDNHNVWYSYNVVDSEKH